MYQLSLIISSLLANTFRVTPPTEVEVERIVVHERLDPRGLNYTDVLYIEKLIRPVSWAKGMTIEEIAHAQGQADLLRIIKDKVIGRRLDGQPTK